MATNTQWIPMREASKLLKVSFYKISQLVNSGELQSKTNIRDKREKLVNLEQAKQVLEISQEDFDKLVKDQTSAE